MHNRDALCLIELSMADWIQYLCIDSEFGSTVVNVDMPHSDKA